MIMKERSTFFQSKPLQALGSASLVTFFMEGGPPAAMDAGVFEVIRKREPKTAAFGWKPVPPVSAAPVP